MMNENRAGRRIFVQVQSGFVPSPAAKLPQALNSVLIECTQNAPVPIVFWLQRTVSTKTGESQ